MSHFCHVHHSRTHIADRRCTTRSLRYYQKDSPKSAPQVHSSPQLTCEVQMLTQLDHRHSFSVSKYWALRIAGPGRIQRAVMSKLRARQIKEAVAGRK